MKKLRLSLFKKFDFLFPIKHSFIMSLISFTGSMLFYVNIVWLYLHYDHRQPSIPLWCGLFCPKKLKATRRKSCLEAALENSNAMSPVHTPAPDYSTKFQTLSPAQSEQNFPVISNPNLAPYREVTPTAPPIEIVHNHGNLSQDNSSPNVQQTP